MKTATKTFQWLVFLLLVIPHVRLAADESELSEQLLGLTDEMRIQLDGATQHGFMEIAPVNLPVNPPGDCNHYGWPIATMVGDTIVVMHRHEKHGVQHIFIYAGHPNGPAGVFRITRTLDTPKLTNILSQASRR